MRAPIEKPTIKFPTKPLPTPIGCIPGSDALTQYVDAKAHAKLDTNHDGQLNRDEFNAGLSPIEKIFDGGDAKFDRYDKDNNGYVSKDEYHAGKQADRNSSLQLPPIHMPPPNQAPLPPGILLQGPKPDAPVEFPTNSDPNGPQFHGMKAE